MRLSFTLLFSALMTLCSLAWAQTATIIKGRLTDQANKEAITGASVMLQGTTTGTVTDLSGAFQIKTTKTGNATVVVSYIGYTAVSKSIVLGGSTIDLGEIALTPDAIGLSEVEVIASVAIDRKTPVAVSTIKPEIITEKLGTKEFPDILKSTPGVYTTRSGGGWGDGRISIRGFGNAYNAVMINGVPVNDMENGAVYWSNWAGLSDVTSSMQVQRGLGAARIAVPSLGGTINIITKTTDAVEGGNAYLGVGNNGYFKQALTYSTGMKNGWAATISGSHTAGNGWVDQTAFEGWSYFVNLTKQFNKNHTLAFTAFGAPQTHDQRSTAMTQAQWELSGTNRRFNSDWGMYEGTEKAARVNFYHKPQISLTHYWNVNEKLDVTTSAYVSVGRGGGQRFGLASGAKVQYTAAGILDYDKMVAENKALAAQGKASKYALISSMNEHNWYGVVSNANYKINEHLTFAGGVDGRYYQGLHYQRLEDPLGGLGVGFNKNTTPVIVSRIGEKVNYNNDGVVRWLSGNAQLEYSKGKLSAFVNASLSHQGYQRIDYFLYKETEAKTEWLNFLGYTLKGGANYNINDKHNVFANVGYFERPPFFGNAYPGNANVPNENAVNEKVFSGELGYGFRSKFFSLSANAYYSQFGDRSFTRSQIVNGVSYFYNMQGIDALHYGVELDMEARPVKGLTLKGMFSLGDWTWQNDVTDIKAFDNNNNPLVDANGKPLVRNAYISGIHVGDAAQLTAALGVNYEILPGLKIGTDFNYYDKLYASFDPANRTVKPADGTSAVDAWKMPSFYIMDMNVSYKLRLGKQSLTFYGNVDNLTDETYISDAFDGTKNDQATSSYYYGMGRTWSAGMKFQF